MRPLVIVFLNPSTSEPPRLGQIGYNRGMETPVSIAVTATIVLGGFWALSKFMPAKVVAILAFLMLVGGSGIIRLCAIGILRTIAVGSFAPRRRDKGLIACPTCGRSLSPESCICPRCETRFPEKASP